MERLTIDEVIYCLKAECERYSEVCEECPLYGKVGCDHCFDDATDIAINALEELKAYKDAEEQGLLIKLPCKVGDTVYTACSWGIESGVVGSIQLISDRVFVNNIQGAMIGEAYNIFPTKAEAEQALAEKKGGSNEV